jgi:hypothetical protein
MNRKRPIPHYFKILPLRSSYDMPGACVNCGRPSIAEYSFKTSVINTNEKDGSRLEITFSLCEDCGNVIKMFHTSDRKSAFVAAFLALLPAGYFLYLQVQTRAEFVPTALPSLIIFGLIYYFLAFILKPLGRLFLKSDYRKIHADIYHSVQITLIDPKTAKFDFLRQDFAEQFEALNRKR